MRSKIWGYIKEYQRTCFLIILIIVIVSILLTTMWGEPAWGTTAVAFGTLLLAIVTAFAIDYSRQQEKRRIEEDRRVREEEKEHKFKKNCMDDINNWAQKGTALLTELLAAYTPAHQKENLIRLTPLRAENSWMMNASRQFDDRQLPRLVDEAAENLKQYVEIIEGVRKAVDIAGSHEQCRKSFVKLLEYVANLKVKLQL